MRDMLKNLVRGAIPTAALVAVSVTVAAQNARPTGPRLKVRRHKRPCHMRLR